MNTVKAELGIRNNYRFIRVSEENLLEQIFIRYPNLMMGDENNQLCKPGWEDMKKLIQNPSDSARRLCSMVASAMAKDQDPRAIVSKYHNLVPSVLRNSFATLISGTTVTPTFKANYFALGTGATAPANSDVQLQTETVRSLFTNRYSETNQAFLDVYFTNAQVGGNTYLEAGIFVDGAAGANTGYLLSRVAINQIVGAAETLTVNCSFTIS